MENEPEKGIRCTMCFDMRFERTALYVAENGEFYQQEYCGCVYSLRDINRWRMSQGRDRIKLGVKFYSNAMDDED